MLVLRTGPSLNASPRREPASTSAILLVRIASLISPGLVSLSSGMLLDGAAPASASLRFNGPRVQSRSLLDVGQPTMVTRLPSLSTLTPLRTSHQLAT